MKEDRTVPTKTTRPGTGAALAASLLAAALLLPAACGKEKAEAPVAEAPSSSCVSCHTDREKLKVETADIKQPKGSALQSGKG